jgi:hypothetical protein
MLRRVLIMIAVTLAAIPASAQVKQEPLPPVIQPSSSRPNRGLFGGGIGETGQLLTLNVSLGGGRDKILFPAGEPSRMFSHGSTRLSYSLDFGRFSASVSGGSTARFYDGRSNDVRASHSADAWMAIRLAERTTLSVGQNLSIAPYNVMHFFEQGPGSSLWTDPVANTTIDPAFAGGGSSFYTFSTNASIQQQINRRISAGVDYHRTESGIDFAQRDPAHQGLSAGITYGVARGLSMRLGYGVSERHSFTGTRKYRNDTFDAGVDFNRALSLSRRARVRFSTGAAGLDDGFQRRYTATGRARLEYQIGRTWTAALSATRGVQFIETIDTPLIANGLRLGTSGLLAPRLQLNADLGVSRGRNGLGAGAPPFESTFGNVGINTSITRYFALGVSYAYYSYRFDDGAVLPVGVSPRRDRQSLRVSLNVWVPLMVRTRSVNASR